MPTFMIFRNGTAVETIRGADPRRLASAVEAAVKTAGPAKPVFSSTGRTLGGPSVRNTSLQRPTDFNRLIQAIIRFFGLYFISLFAVSTPYTPQGNSAETISSSTRTVRRRRASSTSIVWMRRAVIRLNRLGPNLQLPYSRAGRWGLFRILVRNEWRLGDRAFERIQFVVLVDSR
jgi:hypothetical protein